MGASEIDERQGDSSLRPPEGANEIQPLISSADNKVLLAMREGTADSSSPPGQSLNRIDNINRPAQELISAESLAKINGSGAERKDGISLSLDKKYNVIRMVDSSWNNTNFWLSEDGKTVKRVDSYGVSPLAAQIAAATEAGVLRPDTFSKLGLSDEHLENAKRESKTAKQLQSGEIESLPGSHLYRGDKTNTEAVLQGQASVIDVANNPDVKGLYTFGAGPCLVLALTAKDANGVVKQIGLAHIDSGVKDPAIQRLVSAMHAEGQTLSAAIISGERETALRTAGVLDRNKIPITFANVDLDGGRSDAVALDRDGKLYYGSRTDLNMSVDPNQIKFLEAERMMAAMGVSPNHGLNLRRK